MKLKTPTKKKIKTKDRIAEYYDSLDLYTWWEEFSTSSNENGTRKYGTVWAFVCAKAKDIWKRKFLWWLLGPKGESGEYAKYPQHDWEEKRAKGFWYNSSAAERLGKEVKQHKNALDAMREVGKVNVKFLSRLEALAEEIDREYSGRLFLPNLSMKENSFRAQQYTSLLDRLMGMMKEAQIMFGRTQGMDLEKLDDFFQMFTKEMGSAAIQMGLTSGKILEANAQTDKASTTMGKILDMVLAKASREGLDLPDPEMEDIIQKEMKPTLVGRPQ